MSNILMWKAEHISRMYQRTHNCHNVPDIRWKAKHLQEIALENRKEENHRKQSKDLTILYPKTCSSPKCTCNQQNGDLSDLNQPDCRQSSTKWLDNTWKQNGIEPPTTSNNSVWWTIYVRKKMGDITYFLNWKTHWSMSGNVINALLRATEICFQSGLTL